MIGRNVINVHEIKSYKKCQYSPLPLIKWKNENHMGGGQKQPEDWMCT